MEIFFHEGSEFKDAIAVHLLTSECFAPDHSYLSEEDKVWLVGSAFTQKLGCFSFKRSESGALKSVFLFTDRQHFDSHLSAVVANLPEGIFTLKSCFSLSEKDWLPICLAWGRATYAFDRYKSVSKSAARLVLPQSIDLQRMRTLRLCASQAMDLINTPAEDMGPEDLAMLCQSWSAENKVACVVLTGRELLEHGYPTVFRVGRASDRSPRVIDLRWGAEHNLKITLVGKGVCFDTGGLDIKSTAGMRHMKKDMGGAAMAFALAQMIVLNRLPVNLRVIIPTVDNNVSSNSMRPGDVVQTRSGTSVEITNTDAEGRLILCDALTAAAEDDPEFIFDFATLTGAARVALGPDLPALFSNQPTLQARLHEIGDMLRDPVWPLPLHKPYLRYLKSDVADLANASSTGFGGAITAALFLQEFVPDDVNWAHFDTYCWNGAARDGNPSGGAVQAIVSAYEYISELSGGESC